MPIHLKRNPYLGVNAHANSWLLNKSGQWHSFHQEFIVRLTETVNAKLPSGFEARAETPVQIQEILTDKNGESKLGRLFRPVPDTSVFQIDNAPREAHSTPGQTPTLVVAPIETLDMAETAKTPSTVNVYEVITDEELGRLVARIELLSPTNKPPETAEKEYLMAGYEEYRQKRIMALQAGTCLVEIDLIHQQPPVIPRLGIYPRDENAYPYNIAVIDPTPSLEQGTAAIYQFGVDSPFPVFDLPLGNGRSALGIDLSEPYNKTLENNPTLHRLVDYGAPPVREETYSKTDQEHIIDRMEMIVALMAAGRDLDREGPFSIDRALIETYIPDVDDTNQPQGPAIEC